MTNDEALTKAGHRILPVLFLLLTSGAILAGDWPQYRGANRDAAVTDVKLPADWPKELKTAWRVDLGGGFSSPAVAGDRVFVLSQEGAEEVVQCLSVKDGRRLWRHGYAAAFKSSWGGGPRATPTVDGENVYTVGATGELYCLNAADGKVRWRRSFRADFHSRTPDYGHSSSPLADGKNLIVHAGGRDGHSVVALDKLTGELVWKSQDDPPGYASPMIVPVSPKTGPRQLAVFTEKGLISLDPASGRLFWRFDWTTDYEQNIAQPLLDGDLLAITSLSGCAALRLGQADGKPTMRHAWRNNELAVHFSCPVSKDGFIYGVHSRRPQLRCVRMADGAVQWSERLAAEQRADMIWADGRLLIYADTGELLVVEASPKQYRQAARYTVAGKNWVPPVLANGPAGVCLFLRDERNLRCVELPKP